MYTKKRSIGWVILYVVTFFFAALLLLSFAAAFVSPEKFVWFSYFGMIFPFVLVVNIFLAIFLLCNLKTIALLPVFAIALNWSNMQTLAKFKSAEFDTNEKKIRVMSYNVNLFDHYGNINTQEGQTEREILEFISNETPDILCFQEFWGETKNAIPTSFLRQKVGLKYASQSRFNKTISFGNKIYSRFPIIHDSLIRFENSKNLILFADVVAHEDTIRVFNFHLASIRFEKSDDSFYQELTKAPNEVADLKKGLVGLIRKMNAAYKQRAFQANILARLIAQSPYPTLVCGDMNDIPQSYAYKCISKNMNDSFCKRAFGLGTSYSGAYPSFRIDYIFFSDAFYCENFSTIRVRYSDHFPIISDLKIKLL